MAYIVGQLSEDEEKELARRGWTVEPAPVVDFDGASFGPHPDRMRMVWVDSSMFDVMNGPDWDKGGN